MYFENILLLLALFCQSSAPMPKHIEPTVYPLGARLAHLEGTVSAHLEIERDGAVSKIAVDGRPIFGHAVKDSLQRWSFCTNVPAHVDIIFVFRLAGKPLEFNAQTTTIYDLPGTVTVVTQPPVCDHCPDQDSYSKDPVPRHATSSKVAKHWRAR
jgi:hypothetical protein